MDIRLENLTMRFDDVTAVDQLNTTIKDGELVSLLGPSGCGKSTTLMLLSGLYKPTGGKIYFGEEDVTEKEAEKRGIGMVFQNYALYPHLSVLKNIMFPLKMMKVKKKEPAERAMEMARLVQIDHLADRKPGQLSGGQQQRVAIARALVKQPRLLLLDEPLSNLDARLRLEMREEIRRIQQEVGITAVFVTHDQEEALSISDRVMLMKDGVLQQDSEPQHMYQYPDNEFVGRFIGSPPINMIETLALSNGNLNVKDSELLLEVPQGVIESLTGTVNVGIRPEDFYLADRETFLSGEIIYVETIGRDTMIRVACGDQTIRALVDPDKVLNIGDTAHLGVRKDRLHLFNGKSGEQLIKHSRRGEAHAFKTHVEEHA
jgi:multiple sugar transport system ATP-binding protein